MRKVITIIAVVLGTITGAYAQCPAPTIKSAKAISKKEFKIVVENPEKNYVDVTWYPSDGRSAQTYKCTGVWNDADGTSEIIIPNYMLIGYPYYNIKVGDKLVVNMHCTDPAWADCHNDMNVSSPTAEMEYKLKGNN